MARCIWVSHGPTRRRSGNLLVSGADCEPARGCAVTGAIALAGVLGAPGGRRPGRSRPHAAAGPASPPGFQTGADPSPMTGSLLAPGGWCASRCGFRNQPAGAQPCVCVCFVWGDGRAAPQLRACWKRRRLHWLREMRASARAVEGSQRSGQICPALPVCVTVRSHMADESHTVSLR